MKNLATLFLAFGMTTSAAWADCMPKYLEGMRVADVEMAKRAKFDGPCSDKMGCLFPMVTSLGIPNFIVTSEYMSWSADRDRLSDAYRVIREAESGGGAYLIRFRNDIRDSEKGLKSVDLDYVAQAVREANNKNFFCNTDKLSDYKQIKEIVISLL